MEIVLANHSTYPGAPTDAELVRVLREQVDAGLDLVTDGQLDWPSPTASLLAAFDGVRLGATTPRAGMAAPLAQPIVEAKLRRRRPVTLDYYRRAAARSTRPVKTVLTGPFTLAQTATIATTAYASAAALADELAMLLAHEVAALAAIGAPAIQLDEPLLLQHPHEVRRLRELLEPIYDAAAGQTQVIVATHGADAGPLYAQLNSLPADVIAVDCTHPGVCDAIAATGSGKPLALGIVDGTAAAIEGLHALRRLLERLLHRYVQPAVQLQPSCGLRTLPPGVARAKLEVLGALRSGSSPVS